MKPIFNWRGRALFALGTLCTAGAFGDSADTSLWPMLAYGIIAAACFYALFRIIGRRDKSNDNTKIINN